MPKMCVDTSINEIARFIKLTKTNVEFINFKFPYKVSLFTTHLSYLLGKYV